MATWADYSTHTNNYTTGTLKYDVSEAIFRITPDDTPFYNMTGDTTATATQHEWLEEELNTRTDNAQVEGHTFSNFVAPISQARVINYVQTLKRDVRVSRINQRVRQWGITDMFGSNMLKRMREWKTDAEHAAIRGSKTAGTTDTARRMDGAFWCITASGNILSGSGGSFTESVFNDLQELIWLDGGYPEDVMVGSKGKRRISTFTAAADQSYFNTDNTMVRNTISIYESDFTTVTIHLSRDVPSGGDGASAVLMITKTMFSKAWIDKPFSQRLPPLEDAMTGVILGDFTLECGARKAHGAVLYASMVI